MSDTQTKSDPLADRKDDEGNLIDPPVIPEYEQRLQAAHLAGSDDDIADIQAEYNKARIKRATTLAKREQEANR